MSDKREGPQVTVSRSCSGCIHERSESYAVQGDSGHTVSCAHPSLVAPRRIGDTRWDTPAWCPCAAARAALTVDLDCKRCGGTGRLTWRELAPGAQIRCGGPRAPQVKRERLCSCVEVSRDE